MTQNRSSKQPYIEYFKILNVFKNRNLYNRRPIYKIQGIAVRSMGAEESLQVLAASA